MFIFLRLEIGKNSKNELFHFVKTVEILDCMPTRAELNPPDFWTGGGSEWSFCV
jgi:hypothetical protein